MVRVPVIRARISHTSFTFFPRSSTSFTWKYTRLSHIFIYIYTCLSVRLYLINVETAEPIGPKLCVGPHMTSEKVYGCSELKCLQKFYILVKYWKSTKKIVNPQIFFIMVLDRRKMLKDWATMKSFEIEDRPEDLLLSAELIVLYPMWQIFLFLNAVMRHFWV